MIIKLVPKEGLQELAEELPLEVASQSGLIKCMLTECDSDDETVHEIPLYEVDAETLKWIVMYMKHYAEDTDKPFTGSEEDDSKELVDYVASWYAGFIKFVATKQENLYKLIKAADYIDHNPLFMYSMGYLSYQLLLLPDISAIKKFFGITEDMTPEDDKLVRETYPWVLE